MRLNLFWVCAVLLWSQPFLYLSQTGFASLYRMGSCLADYLLGLQVKSHESELVLIDYHSIPLLHHQTVCHEVFSSNKGCQFRHERKWNFSITSFQLNPDVYVGNSIYCACPICSDSLWHLSKTIVLVEKASQCSHSGWKITLFQDSYRFNYLYRLLDLHDLGHLAQWLNPLLPSVSLSSVDCFLFQSELSLLSHQDMGCRIVY